MDRRQPCMGLGSWNADAGAWSGSSWQGQPAFSGARDRSQTPRPHRQEGVRRTQAGKTLYALAQSARKGALNGYFPGCPLETYASRGLGREDGENEDPQPLRTAEAAWLAEGAHGKAGQNWANGAARVARKQLESGGSQYPA